MNSETPGVVRVAGGGSLLRARLCIEQETNHYGFGTEPTPGLQSWRVEVDGNLWPHMGERVPVVFLAEGNRLRLSGEAWVAQVDRDVEAKVDKPLRFVWSSQLAGTGPLIIKHGGRR